MGWAEAVFVIKKLVKSIKGSPETISATGTNVSGSAGTYETVFDVTGAGEVGMLYLLGAASQGTGTDAVSFRWSYRLTLDGEVITPDPANWINWKIKGDWYRFFSAPLQALPTVSEGLYDSVRNWYLTPLTGIPDLTDTLPISFSKSCKLEVYFAQATTVNVAYRVTYNQR